MTDGTFHDPRTGQSFSAEIQLGTYTVTSPSGDSISTTTDEEAEVSQCTCPICSKVFSVDLVPGQVDFEPGLLEFDAGDNLENFWMLI